tara:strand:- start:1217 stop:2056 length:840 start_codon:yes stop_codon:yes gene_type:complete
MGNQASTPANSTDWLDKHGLSDKRRLFVLAYLETQNGTEAARRAGYKSPEVEACRMLKIAKVAAAIEEGRSLIETKALMSAEEVAAQWLELALADPTELTSNIHAPCRYCHGTDGEYQWRTPREFREAHKLACFDLFDDPELRTAAIDGAIEDERLPTDAGGYGYNLNETPNPDCAECSGFGIEVVRMADTRTLSPGARLLFEGVEETKQGKKFKVNDRQIALDRFAKHIGMYAGKVEEQTTSPLSCLVQRLSEASTATPAPLRSQARPAPLHSPLDDL